MAQWDLMKKGDFDALLAKHSHYFDGRWAYFSEVIALVGASDFESIVEIGPGPVPIAKNADVILNPLDDQYGKPLSVSGRTHTFDATISPWPMADKQYDLFIGLQVWEHLDNKQTRAFREVMRVARHAVLSFPYLWDGGEEKPSHRAHRDIDLALIADWTLHVPPTKVVEIPRAGPAFNQGPRMIYYWDFDGGTKSE